MIEVNILGRLGNQLFQYAFAYASAKRLKTYFLLNHSSSPVPYQSDPLIINKYFTLRSYSSVAYKERRLNSTSPKVIKNLINLNSPESNIDSLEDNYCYEGFYQSEAYFKDFKKDILKEFTIKKKFIKEFDSLYGDIFRDNKTIVIHLRRGDYINWSISELGITDPSLPVEYYSKFLSSIKEIDKYKVIFVGDDLSDIRGKYKDCNYYFTKNSDILDFLIIYHADIVCLSNSTFCWWAAYLNQKNDKKIYAPKYWLGYKVKKEFPVDILPKDWNLIDI